MPPVTERIKRDVDARAVYRLRVRIGRAIRYRAENLPQHRALRLEARGPLSRKMWRERIEDV